MSDQSEQSDPDVEEDDLEEEHEAAADDAADEDVSEAAEEAVRSLKRRLVHNRWSFHLIFECSFDSSTEGRHCAVERGRRRRQ